jgi:hypothetical protein
VNARDRVHAMLPILDSPAEADTREQEMNRRLNAVAAEARAAALTEAAGVADKAVALFEGSMEEALAAGALEGLAIRYRRMATSTAKASATDAPEAGVDERQIIRARAVSDVVFLLRYSAGDQAAEKFLADNPDLAELAGGQQTEPVPGFFRAGLTYTRQCHGDTAEFDVRRIEPNPDGGRTAFGFYRRQPRTAWHPYSQDQDGCADGWTEAGAS